MKSLSRNQVEILLATILSLSVVVLDRITKNFFNGSLSLGESWPLIKNFIHMTLVYNTGIAFGFFKDHGAVFILIPVIALILLIFNMYYYRRNEEALSHSYVIGFSLIMGGAIGNLIDRIMFGYVIDFIDFRIWPVFNIADSAITIGAIVVVWECFKISTHQK